MMINYSFQMIEFCEFTLRSIKKLTSKLSVIMLLQVMNLIDVISNQRDYFLFSSVMTKVIILLLAICCLACSFQVSNLQIDEEQKQRTPNSLVFVVFTGVYPDQKLNTGDKLYLRGDNCNMTWSSGILMSKAGINTWNVMLACPTNTLVEFKLLLNDKVWMMGANQWFKTDDRINMTVYPSFNPVPNQIYDTQSVNSTHLNNSRKCSIYIPPSYLDNTLKPYPILFMHDGQNLFIDSKAAFGVAWKIQDTLNDMIFRGEIQEVIVVGIWNTNDRVNEYTYSYDPNYKFGGKGDLYLDFIQQELQPIVRQKWFAGRVKIGHYTIGGSSLGGLISCYAMYTRSQFFPQGICMSSSFWWNSQDFNNKVITSNYNPKTKVYLDSGDQGDSQDDKIETLTVKTHLEKIGYVSSGVNANLFYYLDKGGQHNEYFWGRRFHVPLKSLFNASPKV